MHQVSGVQLARELGDHEPLSSFSIDILRAELQRREDVTVKPSCGTAGSFGSYNVGVHVFALFLILALSTLACSFPIIARRFPDLPIPHRFLFLSRHFGTGVLIATAFIHLLPTAFISMTDPCLPEFWNKGYPEMPGLIAMVSVFLVVTIEMIFASKGAGHTHNSDWTEVQESQSRKQSIHGAEMSTRDDRGHGSIPLLAVHSPDGLSSSNLSSPVNIAEERNSDVEVDDDLDVLDDLDPLTDDIPASSHSKSRKLHQHYSHDHEAGLSSPDQNPKKLFLQCLLLEAGILFHSVFIGMAVSVATGTQFVVLLIAICFHQTFEGFALGSRIASLIPALFDASSPKPWLMALAYGTTTPVGQAIGIWMQGFYDPASEVGLLMVGITNAISSGLLLFAGLVQLVAEDFLSDRSYEVLRGRRRIEASLAVALGGVLMAIVGAFA